MVNILGSVGQKAKSRLLRGCLYNKRVTTPTPPHPLLLGGGLYSGFDSSCVAGVIHLTKSNWPKAGGDQPGWPGSQPAQCISLCRSDIQVRGRHSLLSENLAVSSLSAGLRRADLPCP